MVSGVWGEGGAAVVTREQMVDRAVWEAAAPGAFSVQPNATLRLIAYWSRFGLLRADVRRIVKAFRRIRRKAA